MTRTLSFAALISDSPSRHSFSTAFFFIGFKIEVHIAKSLSSIGTSRCFKKKHRGSNSSSPNYQIIKLKKK